MLNKKLAQMDEGLKRSRRDPPLLGIRQRGKIQRFDPSHCLEEEENSESSDDVNDENGAALEHAYQAEDFTVWIATQRRPRARPIATWTDLTRCCGWIAKCQVGLLKIVRSALGNTNSKQPIAQGFWDWALSETLAGHPPRLSRLQQCRDDVCIFCACTKPCRYQVNGMPMGAACAKLMEAWLSWCSVFATILAGKDRDAIVDLRAITLTLDAVMEAHKRKAEWMKVKK